MSSMQPKISIITINYNNAAGLKETIQSVVAQTYQKIEYIVVDGASSDSSVEVIENFKESIAIAIVEADSGIYNAMNKGVKVANGEYLLFLNSGDRFVNQEIISTVVSEKLDTDIVYGDLLFFDNKKEWKWNLPSELTFQTFFTSAIAHPSTFIKRSLFESIGLYDEALKIVADWKFLMLAIVKYNCSYKHLNHIISAYSFDGVSSKPENLEALNREREKVLLAEFPRLYNDYEELYFLKEEFKKIRYFTSLRKTFKKLLGQK